MCNLIKTLLKNWSRTPNQLRLLTYCYYYYTSGYFVGKFILALTFNICLSVPKGIAIGPLVYANFATEDDFQKLETHNISINGSILLVRLCDLHPGVQFLC
ncbi:hypothetical protein Avbf_10024 [Armadillidium vulgare]|nr:hypothetical protein Avbf_10024 [Armadillidium vulgare]